MKTIIVIITTGFLLFSCAAWNKKKQISEVRSSEKEVLTKSGTADVKVNRSITDFSQTVSGKMNLSIVPGNSQIQDSTIPKAPRKVKIKDAAGNEAEYDIQGNEAINFGSETISKTLLMQVQDSISILQNNFENLQKNFDIYKKQKESESKKTGLQFGAYLTLLGLGAVGIVVIALLVYFGKLTFYKKSRWIK
ncbi:hypothetical protein ATE49_04710 [Elizabethkingia miricola]|uniref:DUF4349 domain-containing protein n=1 Tax=Elizabethkingia miricola TaxID=172045 RepID=A0ABY3NFA9_ELIMR|nr:hypothetical protein [Elizabethkingia miricola]OBS12528.1 hypothetical protein ATE49_04710 [Elizabethkingia miricola]TYO91144.1 hypothetical protein LX74_02465 [Elizabethkingia miricola]